MTSSWPAAVTSSDPAQSPSVMLALGQSASVQTLCKTCSLQCPALATFLYSKTARRAPLPCNELPEDLPDSVLEPIFMWLLP